MRATHGEQVPPGYQNMPKVLDSWLTASSEGGWRDAKWSQLGKEGMLFVHLHYPPLHPCCTGRDVHLLTMARDEDLHWAAERSHSSFGDSSHTDGAGGISGHHRQDGQAGVLLGFSGDVLLERGREEKSGLGETAGGKPRDLLNCPLAKCLCCFAFTSPEEMQHQAIYRE